MARLLARVAAPLGVALALVSPAAAEEPANCAEQLAARIQSRYDGIRDLEARFEQTTQSISLGSSPLADPAPQRGKVVFEKPGKMRWTYEDPTPSLVVSDGKTLWIVDPVGKEVQRLDVSQGYLSGAALVFLMGDGVLADEFTVSVAAAADCGGAEPIELELKPIREATYQQLGLFADPKTGEIAATTIVDLFGNVTRVKFEDWAQNRDPEDSVFRFDGGDEFNVIDLSTPQ